MNVTVEGKIKKSLAKNLHFAASFYAKRLLHPRTLPHVYLDIEVSSKFPMQGECILEDWDSYKPRWFNISLRNKPSDDCIFLTLAHEMVHLKQYVKKELRVDEKITDEQYRGTWLGEHWYPKKDQHHYFDSPWEIEAYGKERGLHSQWLDIMEAKDNACFDVQVMLQKK